MSFNKNLKNLQQYITRVFQTLFMFDQEINWKKIFSNFVFFLNFAKLGNFVVRIVRDLLHARIM